MSPSDRLHAYSAYRRPLDVFDPVAWRPPAAPRFDPRPANDTGWTMPYREAPRPAKPSLPGWAVVTFGGLFAALAGALLGGMLQI